MTIKAPKPFAEDTKEFVDHPVHYQGAVQETRHILKQLGVSDRELDGECIETIERYPHIYGGFHLGNALKYLWRCGQKGDRLQDLQKTKWYLQRYLDYGNPGPGGRERVKQAIASIDQLIQSASS